MVPDPIRGAPHLLVMCEVLSPNGEPHPTNTRAQLAALINDKVGRGVRVVGYDSVGRKHLFVDHWGQFPGWLTCWGCALAVCVAAACRLDSMQRPLSPCNSLRCGSASHSSPASLP